MFTLRGWGRLVPALAVFLILSVAFGSNSVSAEGTLGLWTTQAVAVSSAPEAVPLSGDAAVPFKKNPEDCTVRVGEPAAFDAVCDTDFNENQLVYRWYGRLKDSQNWQPVSSDTDYEPGKETSILNDQTARDMDGTQFKCTVINVDGLVLAESSAATLTVTDPIWVKNITIHRVSNSVHAQSVLLMKAMVEPADASIKTVRWSVTDGTGSASIDENSGLLTGGIEGTVTVTTEAADGSGVKATAEITVLPALLPMKADTSWYNPDGTVFNLSTREQLNGLAALVNGGTDTMSGKTINLTADIDFSGLAWQSIGDGQSMSSETFCGTFDGQGHTVTLGDLTAVSPDSLIIGLFGHVGSMENPTVLRDLNIAVNGSLTAESTVAKHYDFVGALAGRILNTTVENVRVGGTGNLIASAATDYGTPCVGGLVGVAQKSTLNRCASALDIHTPDTDVLTATNYGGIAGAAVDTRILNCENSGSFRITTASPLEIGGIASTISGDDSSLSSMISNSYNRGDMTLTLVSDTTKSIEAGGITGDVFKSQGKSCKVENTYSAGTIMVDSAQKDNVHLGGIAGIMRPEGEIVSNYFDATLLPDAHGIGLDEQTGAPSDAGAAGLSSADMKSPEKLLKSLNAVADAQTDYLSWKTGGDGYPVLTPKNPARVFSITATAGSGGTVAPAGTVTVKEGENMHFTISPDPGCQIRDVLADGVSVGEVSEYSFTAVSADHTLTAYFEPQSRPSPTPPKPTPGPDTGMSNPLSGGLTAAALLAAACALTLAIARRHR
ncbi:Ig-like domain-containing protein [Eubacterium sp. 1001713B170207_170306_E7]|uniref:Ig-like domain-containing protein n=1 Tax=Eubacterium sp. 1001713B170207_170306_E7 TaxID=2787097 RepID=UPI00189A4003|nr:Ig-like domain-containing protein [Eubacterium sp. 1001713B170207_170306_E7]